MNVRFERIRPGPHPNLTIYPMHGEDFDQETIGSSSLGVSDRIGVAAY
jgi:hypothetical protein